MSSIHGRNNPWKSFAIKRTVWIGEICVSLETSWNIKDLPDDSVGKESACDTGNPGSFPGSEWSPGKGNGNPLQ